MNRFAKLVSFASALLLASSVGIARADSIDTFQNTPGNHTGHECCFEVQLDQVDSKDIKVTVTLIDGATFFAGTGSGNHPGFAFSLQGDPTISVTGFDSTYWSYSSANVTPSGGFGQFNNQLDFSGNGASDKVSTLSFNIYDASGIDFSDFISNSYGNYFVADILGSNGRTGLSGIDCDGVVTHGNVPEPSSLLLLGTGILSASAVVRRRLARAIVNV
ncbi:MAG TPA: PEP-CTERM sorting domain-containing protein [Acidobacteriaceae bacterium]|nr:PEP-CTERM sorting domain-containing protein [Acidobacteriaceae bacterium]